MFLRRFTDFVLRSRVQAMATAFVIAFLPIIGSVSVLIAALVTLRKGAVEGAYVIMAAILPYIISYFAVATGTTPLVMMVMSLGIVVLSSVSTWVFASILRRMGSWSVTLEIAALLGVIAVAAVHISYPDIQEWWATQLGAYFTKTVDSLGKLNSEVDAGAAKALQVQTIAMAKHYATGFLTVSVLFNALLQLLIARWWQALMFNPGGLRKELYKIRLSHLSGVVFIVGLVLAFFDNQFALDAIPILYAVFFVAGLSLLHDVISATKLAWVWLLLIYVGIIWMFPLSVILVSIIALFDTGIDFRKRFMMKR